jgi:hypothetical protein
MMCWSEEMPAGPHLASGRAGGASPVRRRKSYTPAGKPAGVARRAFRPGPKRFRKRLETPVFELSPNPNPNPNRNPNPKPQD